MIKRDIMETLKMISKWHDARERLFLGCIPFHEVKREYDFYMEIGDIALIPYIHIFEDDENMIIVSVNKDMVKTWEVPEEVVWDKALRNSHKETRYALGLLDLNGGLYEDIDSGMITLPIVCVTNKNVHYGAANIFVPGVADKVCKAFKVDSLLIGFTSRNEAMVHPNDGRADPEAILLTLRGMNETISKDYFLSNHVFKYEDKKFNIIA